MNLLLQTNPFVPLSASYPAWLFFLECPALLLLLSLLLLPLGLPVLGAPPRLICDSRVLERYILEAKEAENVTVRPPPSIFHRTHSQGSRGLLQDPSPDSWTLSWHLVKGWRWEAKAPNKNDKTSSL